MATDEIPSAGSQLDAAEDDEQDEARQLLPSPQLGEPFGLAEDCAIVEEHGAPLVLRCGTCEALFRLDLLRGDYKLCPQCQQAYTHILLVCAVDNERVLPAALNLVFGRSESDDEESEDEEREDESDHE